MNGNGYWAQHRCCQKGNNNWICNRLGSTLGGISTRRNMNQSLMLPIAIIRVVSIPQMVLQI
jgi:hypothetical protein